MKYKIKIHQEDYSVLMKAIGQSEIIICKKNQNHLDWRRCSSRYFYNYGMKEKEFFQIDSETMEIWSTFTSFNQIVTEIYLSRRYHNDVSGLLTFIHSNYLLSIKNGELLIKELREFRERLGYEKIIWNIDCGIGKVKNTVDLCEEADKYFARQYIIKSIQTNHFYNDHKKTFKISIDFGLPDKMVSEALESFRTKE